MNLNKKIFFPVLIFSVFSLALGCASKTKSMEDEGISVVDTTTTDVVTDGAGTVTSTDGGQVIYNADGSVYSGDGSAAVTGTDAGLIGTDGSWGTYDANTGSATYTDNNTVVDATPIIDSPISFNSDGSDSGQVPGLTSVNFGYDVSNLSSSARSALSQNIEWVSSNPNYALQLEGHCDDRGSTEYNLALGDRRAQAVKNYLVSMGVSPSKLITISYGKEKLLTYGDSEEAHRKNRRVNFVPVNQ